MILLRRLLRDHRAASAAEFALVLPLLLILLLGIIDAGRWMWTFNRAEKATQMGARFAVVADPISSGINASYLGVGGLTQGDAIPAADFGKMTCNDTTCTCATAPCPSGTFTQQNFRNIVDRMRLFMPEIQYSNVSVEYSSTGLGYAGNPNGADISPLITIKLSGLQFTPITSFLFVTMSVPTATTSLTAEDLNGSQAY